MPRLEGLRAGSILLAGLILAWPAAWNGYPLVFADTGTYLGQAIHLYLGWDRPPHYSLFLHALHWRVTLWTVPLVQGLLAAHLLALSLRVLGRPGAGPLLGTAVLLAVATGLPWFAAQLQPDIFTGLLVLALWVLAFGWERLGRFERPYLMLFAAGAIAVHLAHLPLAGGLLLLGAALAWAGRGLGAAQRAARRMAVPVALAVASLLAVNLAGHGRLSVSPFGSVFLAARLIEDGPAVRTLDARCGTAAWRLCEHRERLPMFANDFLWKPWGPLRAELGGGKAWSAEARALVLATLAREPGAVARAAIANALRQFAMLRTGDGLEPWRGEPGPEPLIASHFPGELGAYQGARQHAGALQRDARAIAPLHVALAWAGLLALPALAWRRRRDLPAAALCVLVLAAGAGNAAVTGGLSGPNERYQARLAWLFVFAPVAVAGAMRIGQAGMRRRLEGLEVRLEEPRPGTAR